MGDFIIRNIREEDISSVVDIQISGWKTDYKGIIDDDYLNSMDRDKKIEKRKRDYKDNGFIVAELNKKIVGFCRYIDSNKFSNDIENIDCELLAIYVKPDMKYKGIGTKLVQFVIDEFKRKNKTKMIIWCLKDNEPSKKFYKKMGGKILIERNVEIGNKTYSEVGIVYDL